METKPLLLLLLSVFILLCCLTSFILGILSLAYFWSAHVFPISSGYGMWTCLLNLASGVLGLAASLCIKSKPHVAYHLHLHHMIMSGVSGALLGQMIRYSAIIYQDCTANVPANYCSRNKDMAIGLAIAQLVISALLLLSIVPAIILFCIWYCPRCNKHAVTKEQRNKIITLS